MPSRYEWQVLCPNGQQKHEVLFANKADATYWSHSGHFCKDLRGKHTITRVKVSNGKNGGAA
jgi:hypothetical protein